MGNKQNKVMKKFGSLNSQNFPAGSDESIRRRWSTRSRLQFPRSSEQLTAGRTSWPAPLVDTLFLPEFPIKGDVDENDFEVLDVVAQGAFGNVLKVRKEEDKRLYAMKVLRKSQVIVEGAVQQCRDEATIQSILGHHPMIVRAHHYWQSRKHLYIVTDFVSGGELFDLWSDHGPFNEGLTRIYIAELALAIDFLNKAGVVYRDVKMENVLIDDQGHLQLIDFGLAKWLKKDERTRTICGTLQYIAPEVLSSTPYSHAVDWWSLGIMMYAFLTGMFPVHGASDHHQMAALIKKCDFEMPQIFSWEAADVVNQLLDKDPRTRLTCADALQRHPFFKIINFDHVYDRSISPKNFYPSVTKEGFLQRHLQLLNDFQGEDDGSLQWHFKDFAWTRSTDAVYV